jgi:hypothetical protein
MRFKPESPLFDCCEACANRRQDQKRPNETWCRGKGSTLEGQNIAPVRFIQGRLDAQSANFCGKWTGGNRFEKKTHLHLKSSTGLGAMSVLNNCIQSHELELTRTIHGG